MGLQFTHRRSDIHNFNKLLMIIINYLIGDNNAEASFSFTIYFIYLHQLADLVNENTDVK